MVKKILSVFLAVAMIFTGAAAGLLPTEVQAETDQSKSFNKRTLDKNKSEKYKEGEALVLFKAGTSQKMTKAKAASELDGSYQVKDLWNFNEKQTKSGTKKAVSSTISVALVKSKTLTTEQLIKALKKNANVQTAEPNYRLYATSLTNDKYIGYQWGIDNTGQNGGTPGADTNVKSQWDKGTKGSDDVVAIVDTGVDYTHEDLKANMWNNPYEPTLKGRYGFDIINGDDDPLDDNGHGSHCAGVIGAKGNNGTGTTGINQNAKIMALKILDEGGSGYGSESVGAYQYISKAMDMGVKVRAINNSWGGGENSEIFEKLFNVVGQKGAISICSAGNDGEEYDGWMQAPAGTNSPYKIIVAASDENNRLAGFSSYGKNEVDLAAPGTGILSTVSYDSFNPSIYSKEEIQTLTSQYTDYEASSTDEIKWGVPKASSVAPSGTKSAITIDANKYFGNTAGKSLKVELKDMEAGDFATVRIPYSLGGIKDSYETPPAVSAMVCAQAPKLSEGSSDSAENVLLLMDVTKGKAVKSFEDAIWNEEAIGFYIDEKEPSWDHLSMPVTVTKENTPQEREMVFGISCGRDGDYVLNLDDVGVSKENIDSSKFGKYDFMSGTSMATPFVSGAVALLGAANPTLNASEIVGKTLSSVKKVPDLAGKVATGGTLDFGQVSAGMPRIKDVTVDMSKKQIHIKGSGFEQNTVVEINKKKAEIISCKSSEIIVKDENWINTYADLKVTNGEGIAEKEDVYLVKGKKAYTTADQTIETSMKALTTDGTNIYGVNSSEDTVYQYNVAAGTKAADTAIAEIDGEKLMKMKGTADAPLDFSFGANTVYMDGKLYNVASMGQSIESSSDSDFTIIIGDLVIDGGEDSSDAVAYTANYRLISVDPQSKKKEKAVNLGALPSDMKRIGNSTIAGYNGKLYMIGGYDYETKTLSTKVKIYDPATKKWSNGPKLPEGRASGKALQVGGKLVYTLGYSTEKTCPENLVLSGGKWTKSSAKLNAVEPEPTTVSGEKYYLFQGTVGICAGGLVYSQTATETMGDTFTYSLSSDKYVPSEYQFNSQPYETGSLNGLTVASTFYGIKGTTLYKMPVKSGFATVSAPKMTGGTISGTNTPIVPGTLVTLKAVPKKGYAIKSFKIDGKTVKGSTKTIRVTTNQKASAVFVKQK